MKRKKITDRSVIFLILILVVLSVTTVFIFTHLKTDKITTAVKEGENLNILLLSTDLNKLAFTELFIYNPVTHKGSLFDIPGNVGAILSGVNKMDRIDSVFSIRKPEKYIKEVEKLTGLNIPFHIIFDRNTFSGFIDIFEGIKVFIPNPVEVIAKDKIILLPSGNVVLDGAKAEEYINYREEGESVIESISRQQKALQALFSKIGEKNQLLSSKKVQSALYSRVSTNLSKTSFIALLDEMKLLNSDKIIFQRVLGKERKLDNKTLLFPHYEGKLLKETVAQTITSLAEKQSFEGNGTDTSIDVLNGTTQNGLASRTTHIFKSFGFDILNITNYSNNQVPKTIVISRGMDTSSAVKVADVIKCKNIKYSTDVEITNEDILNDSADVIVILGNDFDGRYCKN